MDDTALFARFFREPRSIALRAGASADTAIDLAGLTYCWRTLFPAEDRPADLGDGLSLALHILNVSPAPDAVTAVAGYFPHWPFAATKPRDAFHETAMQVLQDQPRWMSVVDQRYFLNRQDVPLAREFLAPPRNAHDRRYLADVPHCQAAGCRAKSEIITAHNFKTIALCLPCCLSQRPGSYVAYDCGLLVGTGAPLEPEWRRCTPPAAKVPA